MAATKQAVVVFSILMAAVAGPVSVQSRTVDFARRDSSKTGWDSLLFSLHWPVTACLTWRDGKPGNTCALPENHVWTIHGIWPNQEGGEGPFFCNRTWRFDPKQVEAFRPQLIKVWPNIHGNDTEDSLWKHEWEKHGTCAANDPKFATEALYFKQGIQWLKTYHMTKILSMNNIIPSFSIRYNATKIHEVLKSVLGVDAAVGCEFDKKTGLTYLSEIRLCFTKELQLMSCQHHHKTQMYGSVMDCPVQKEIAYPGKHWLLKTNKQYKKMLQVKG